MPGPPASLWLTALVFDWPYGDPNNGPEAIARRFATRTDRDDALSAALVMHWNRDVTRPHYRAVPVPGGMNPVLEVIFAITFLLPLVNAATQTPARKDTLPLEALGIGVGFVNQLRDTVVPGTWAMLLLATADQVDGLARLAHDTRPTARTAIELTSKQIDAFRQVYGGDSAEPR